MRVGAEGLRTAFCEVHRYRPTQDDLLHEAAYGWHSDVAGLVVLRADVQTVEGRAFVTRAPVICNAPRDPVGSNRPGSQAARRALSTVHVIIKGDYGRPYGVLGASNNAGQHYDQHDVDFLSRIADLVAASVAGFERTAILIPTIEGFLVEAPAMFKFSPIAMARLNSVVSGTVDSSGTRDELQDGSSQPASPSGLR